MSEDRSKMVATMNGLGYPCATDENGWPYFKSAYYVWFDRTDTSVFKEALDGLLYTLSGNQIIMPARIDFDTLNSRLSKHGFILRDDDTIVQMKDGKPIHSGQWSFTSGKAMVGWDNFREMLDVAIKRSEVEDGDEMDGLTAKAQIMENIDRDVELLRAFGLSIFDKSSFGNYNVHNLTKFTFKTNRLTDDEKKVLLDPATPYLTIRHFNENVMLYIRQDDLKSFYKGFLNSHGWFMNIDGIIRNGNPNDIVGDFEAFTDLTGVEPDELKEMANRLRQQLGITGNDEEDGIKGQTYLMESVKSFNDWCNEISNHPRLKASNCRVRIKDRMVLNEEAVLHVYNNIKDTFDSKEDTAGSQYSFDLFEDRVQSFNERESNETTINQMITFLNSLGFEIEKREDFGDWMTENITYAIDTYNCDDFEPKNPTSIGPFGMKGQNIIWTFLTEYDAYLEIKWYGKLKGFRTEEHSNSIKLLDDSGATRMQMRVYPGSTLILDKRVIKKTYDRAIRLLGVDKDDESGIIKTQTLL